MPIQKALVPVDGSEVSLKAVELAARFAAKHGWEVVLLYVLERPPMPRFAFPDGVKEETLQDMRDDAMEVLSNAQQIFLSKGITATLRLVEGSAAEMILQEVEEGCCQIIVLGSTGLGRGKLGSLLLGSVAEQIIRRVRIPILLVKEDTEIG